MKNENLNTQATELQIQNAITSFNPFGYLDIKAATNAALQAGKTTDFVYESVSEFADSCGMKIEDCDPVYCVMDAILQEARTEIEEVTGLDFCNDFESGEFYTVGNYMSTSYDYKTETKKELIEALKNVNAIIENLSDSTQYFLSELEISQEDLTD